MYKVEMIPENIFEQRLNELNAEGWMFMSFNAHPFITADGCPIYVTILRQI